MAHFIRYHKRVLALLDLCEELSILPNASAPWSYRDHRNLEQLVVYVCDANVFTLPPSAA